MPDFDQTQARSEGWCVIDVDQTGYLEIEMDDELFPGWTDAHALWYVVEKARAGSQYHRDALALCGITISGEPEERPRVS